MGLLWEERGGIDLGGSYICIIIIDNFLSKRNVQ